MSESQTTLRLGIVDTETTGFSHEDDRLIQVALILPQPNTPVEEWPVFNQYCNPGIPIPATASAVHHITDLDVAQAPPVESLVEDLVGFIRAHAADIDALVAHNAPFDRGFLPALSDHAWIDTRRWAQHLIPEAPGFSNQVLRYHLGCDVPKTYKGRTLEAHDALADVIVTSRIAQNLMRMHHDAGHDLSVDGVRSVCERPLMIESFPFGKHRGVAVSDVIKKDPGYVRWALSNIEDMDADLKATLIKRSPDALLSAIAGSDTNEDSASPSSMAREELFARSAQPADPSRSVRSARFGV
ncbi:MULTISPECIES: exonuclease domain-containing protein [unclassified Thioalkalivibrio]|uniref:exonuclease domain-containing protein n=1 Tax=unclassified Thioalkalivibrio TaxID=2621013 RepID=UPI0003700B25|nr:MULTISPECIES: exonuclease domain-containing protein [unclassified Thioalkalivibrio]